MDPAVEQGVDDDEDIEYRKEALTMALYVAICLLAALVVLPEDTTEDHAIGVIWGTTLGLALAHWFAFRVAARMVAQGPMRPHDALAAGAQLAGAAAVAAIATVPTFFWSGADEIDAVIFVLAAFIAVVGYGSARTSGGSKVRSVAYAGGLLVVALGVVLVKVLVSGH